jgi:peptidoglycan hydrolase-like protein with peptidoglycan-binding domain
VRKIKQRVGWGAVVLAAGVVGTVGPAPSASARVGVPPIGPRSGNGAGVMCVVTALNTYLGTNLVNDGIYGPNVAAAVAEFQQRFGIRPDGIVGPTTGDHIWPIDKADGDASCYQVVPTTH